jgi:hypothetical protein
MAGYSVTYSVVDNATKQIDAINKRIAQMRAPVERMSRSISRFVDVSGLRKVAQGFDYIWKAAGSVLRTLTQIVPVLGTITGAATLAGMVKLVQSYAAWSQELVRTASSLGTTTQTLQRFEDATRLAGGNAADMRQSLKGLFDTLADFKTGQGAFALTAQWANQLKINLRDANGVVRKADELFPELIQKLADMQNPADRAAASIALLGAGGDKLVEAFRQSSKPFAQWLKDVERYKDLTDEQKRSLQLFSEAQGRLGVGFDRLGAQMSLMIAEHFTPMINSFSGFVEQNTPQILDAAKRIGDSFGRLWTSVAGDMTGQQAIKSLTDNIVALVDSLKWLVDKGNSVADVLNRLANIKSRADLTRPITKNDEPVTVVPGHGLPGPALNPAVTDFFEKLRDRIMGGPANIRPGYQQQSSSGGYLPGGVTPASYGGGAALSGVGGGEFFILLSLAVRKGFEDAIEHLRGVGAPTPGGPSGGGGGMPGVQHASFSPAGGVGGSGPAGGVGGGDAGGSGGIAAPAGTAIARTGLATVTSASGRKFQVDARFAPNFQGFINDYEKAGGVIGPDSGTLGSRPHNASGHPVGAAIDINQIGRGVRSNRAPHLDPRLEDELAKKWGMVSGNSWRSNDQGHFGIQSAEAARRALLNNAPGAGYKTLSKDQLDLRPPVTVPPAAPINGSVDVSITHKNAPPNSAVTASGAGSVNVAPVRVEHQNMADI